MLSGSLPSFQVSSVLSIPEDDLILMQHTDKPAGYHGYWAEDLYAINSNYGSAADLKSLVNTAHSKVFPGWTSAFCIY